jgi:hypothetical protein
MSSLLSCRLCGQAIKFDDKHVSHRTGKKIPLDIDTEEPHDCPVWKGSQQYQPQQQQRINSSNHNNKGGIINVSKAVARKSILMQTTKARAENGFH